MDAKSRHSPLSSVPSSKPLPLGANSKEVYCTEYPRQQSPPPARVVLLQPQQHLNPVAAIDGDKEKLALEPENNNNIVNYKYFSQIETLKKRSIQPQLRFDQIMTNNETSLRATVYQSTSPTMASQQQMQPSQEPVEHNSCQESESSVELKEELEVDDPRPASAPRTSTPLMESLNVAEYPPAYLKQYTDLKTEEALDVAIMEAASTCGNSASKSPSQSANDRCEDLSAGYRRCDFGSLGPPLARIDTGIVDTVDAKNECADRFALGGELNAKDGSHGYDQTSVRSDEGYHSNGFHDDALTPPHGCVDSDDSDVALDFR